MRYLSKIRRVAVGLLVLALSGSSALRGQSPEKPSSVDNAALLAAIRDGDAKTRDALEKLTQAIADLTAVIQNPPSRNGQRDARDETSTSPARRTAGPRPRAALTDSPAAAAPAAAAPTVAAPGASAGENPGSQRFPFSDIQIKQRVADEIAKFSSKTENFPDIVQRLSQRLGQLQADFPKLDANADFETVVENAAREVIEEHVAAEQQQAWFDAIRRMLANLVAKYDGFDKSNTSHWQQAISYAIESLNLATKQHNEGTSQGIDPDFWLNTAQTTEANATYWDSTFVENAERLADIFDKLAADNTILDAAAMRKAFERERTSFLDQLDNTLTPNKRSSWESLIESWQDELSDALEAGKFDANSLVAHREAYRVASKSLRKASGEWDVRASRESASNRSRTDRSDRGMGAADVTGSYWSDVWHERMMSHIYRTHHRRMNRIERITARR